MACASSSDSIHDWAKTQPGIRKYKASGGIGHGYSNLMLGMPPPYAAYPPPPLESDEFDDAMDVEMDLGLALDFVDIPFPGPSVATHPTGTGYVTRKAKQASKSDTKTLDLLDEYDKGIQKIREWKPLGDGVEE